MAIDWTWIEELVVKHADKGLSTFADAHRDHTFYGAMFLVEPFDGVGVSILLNTREHLVGDVGEVDADNIRCKWLPGAFGFRIPISTAIDAWSEIDDSIVEATEADMETSETRDDGLWPTSGRLVDAVCRAALRLDQAFGRLNRTPDFALAVTPDAREPGEVAIKRLADFRAG